MCVAMRWAGKREGKKKKKNFPGEYGRIQQETRNLAWESGCVSNPVVDQARQIYAGVSRNARAAVSETAGFAFRAPESPGLIDRGRNLFSFFGVLSDRGSVASRLGKKATTATGLGGSAPPLPARRGQGTQRHVRRDHGVGTHPTASVHLLPRSLSERETVISNLT